MPGDFDRNALEAIVADLADRLVGKWLLIGGAAIALWVDDRRVTEDLDLISLGNGAEDRLRLMEAAEGLGLPIEAVNSAADFFVRRIDSWQEEIEILTHGQTSTIYRPTVTLFLLLKIGRLSERDLADIEAILAKAAREHLPWDRDRIRQAMENLPGSEDEGLTKRRQRVVEMLGA